MLTGEEVRERRKSWGMVASFAFHLVALAVLLYRPEPIFVSPQSVQLGNGSKSYHVVYVPPNAVAADEPEPINHSKLALHAAVRRPRVKPAPVTPKEQPVPNPQGEVADKNANVGNVY